MSSGTPYSRFREVKTDVKGKSLLAERWLQRLVKGSPPLGGSQFPGSQLDFFNPQINSELPVRRAPSEILFLVSPGIFAFTRWRSFLIRLQGGRRMCFHREAPRPDTPGCRFGGARNFLDVWGGKLFGRGATLLIGRKFFGRQTKARMQGPHLEEARANRDCRSVPRD